MSTIDISNYLHIKGLANRDIKNLKEKLTLLNPKWIENNKMGYWNGKTPKYIKGYKQKGQTLIIPRGCFNFSGIYPLHKVIDNRRVLPSVDLNFNGVLRPYQQEAVEALLKRDEGVLSAPTGSGKTCIALYMVAQRQQPALVIVHTKDLLRQWVDRIEKFLKLSKKEIGIIGGGKCKIRDVINVGMVQTLYKKGRQIADKIGFVIVDECHRTPARTFLEALTQFDAKYLLGLSATPWRRDRLTELIHWYLGPLVHEIDQDDMIESGNVLPIRVIRRYTDFDTDLDASTNYSKVMCQLRADIARNNMIADDIAKEAGKKGIIIALSDSREHCWAISRLLLSRGIPCVVVTGELPIAARDRVLQQVQARKIKLLIATGQLLGEGFDCPGLTTMFLMTPIKFDGRLLQYLGRIRRPAPGKKRAVVYDYIDRRVGVLYASAISRGKVYRSLKINN